MPMNSKPQQRNPVTALYLYSQSQRDADKL